MDKDEFERIKEAGAMLWFVAQKGQVDATPIWQLQEADKRGDLEAVLGLIPKVLSVVNVGDSPRLMPGTIAAEIVIALDVAGYFLDFDSYMVRRGANSLRPQEGSVMR